MKPVIRVLNNDVLARVVDGAGYMVCSPADNDLGGDPQRINWGHRAFESDESIRDEDNAVVISGKQVV